MLYIIQPDLRLFGNLGFLSGIQGERAVVRSPCTRLKPFKKRILNLFCVEIHYSTISITTRRMYLPTDKLTDRHRE